MINIANDLAQLYLDIFASKNATVFEEAMMAIGQLAMGLFCTLFLSVVFSSVVVVFHA